MSVYTFITQQQALYICYYYQLGTLIKFIPIKEGIDNSNYHFVVEQEGKRYSYIYTIFEKRLQSQDIPFFIELMHILSRHNFPCPCPVRHRDNDFYYQIQGKQSVVVTFMQGEIIYHPTQQQHFQQIGYYSALWHKILHNTSLKRTNDLSLSGWETLTQKIGSQLTYYGQDIADLIKNELYFLQSQWVTSLPQTIAHLDLFPNNVFFTHHKLSGIIDFYFSANDSMIYDLAITISAWCINHDGVFNQQHAHDILLSYHMERPITAYEWEALPIMMRGACMRFLLTRFYDAIHTTPSDNVTILNPLDYVKKLQCCQQLQKDNFFYHD